MNSKRPCFILLLSLAAYESPVSTPADAFSFDGTTAKGSAPSPSFPAAHEVEGHPRPLLRDFGRGISRRIRHSKEGANRSGQAGAYTSDETIPHLDMQGSGRDTFDAGRANANVSSRGAIRMAFTETSGVDDRDEANGRSSGSGCTIVRLTGADAASIHGLTDYTNRFFEQVDKDDCNGDVKHAGVFRIDNHVYAGFDDDVNGEGKMQFLDTRILPNKYDIDPVLIPMEVGDLVGTKSLGDAHKGIGMLLDIGTQITSAVLDMDALSADKLIDDGTHAQQRTSSNEHAQQSESNTMTAGDVSNSYHRLIRYLIPQQSSDGVAFQAHVDSSFLTLIPMPELPGLEVWCPSNAYNAIINEDMESKGEWVTIPALESMKKEDESNESAYVVAMAGEFLQLTSNGQVPVCIHRVIPPKAPVVSPNSGLGGEQHGKYRPRVSAPIFLRPRRGEDALLDVSKDLKLVEKPADAQSSTTSKSASGEEALYYEEGLLEECDSMHLWSVHEIMHQQ